MIQCGMSNTRTRYNLWEGVPQHRGGGALERLLQHPHQCLVPGLDGLVVGNVQRGVHVEPNAPARPRLHKVLVPQSAQLVMCQ